MDYKKSIVGSSIALILATSCCWLPALIIAVGGGSALIALSNGLEKFSGLLLAAGIGLLGFGIYQFKMKKNKSVVTEVNLNSVITCPECGFMKEEKMPTNACQYFYDCENCQAVLKPQEGDCCVYCSYGSVPCPPIQLDEDCC